MKTVITRIMLLVAAAAWLMACQPPANQATDDSQQVKPIKGVWLTNVASDALDSKENIHQAVDLCEKSGINTIYMVTWNKAMTMYPSQVMKNLTGVEIDPKYQGRDPLAELIDYAHQKDIRVLAWFEFGFAASYNENGGILIEKRPEWASADSNGELVKKNNFEWLNGFHPEVQNFMISLIMEVVRNYDVDGIQGDDRLPAMPVQAGYDDYTRQLYADSHGGKQPPEDKYHAEWVQWRANKMTDFLIRLRDSVKTHNPELIISMAPSVYPWSKHEYLQDWPVWLNMGYADEILPQFYRYDIEAYQHLLDQALRYQIAPEHHHKFYPGILLQVGEYNPDKEFLKQMIQANRQAGVPGEVFFFYEGLKHDTTFFIHEYPEM